MRTAADSARVAVLTHFHRPDACALAVNSLAADEPDLPIVVIDNGSEAASYLRLRELLRGRPNCAVVRSSVNVGYAGVLAGADRLVPALRGDGVIYFGAHDVAVAPGTLRRLQAALKEGGAAVAYAACKPLEEGFWSPIRGPRKSPIRAPDGLPAGAWIEGLYFPTPLLAIDRRLWSEGLRPDPALFCYREECDLGLRARSRGLRSVLVPDAVVENRESGGTSTAELVAYYAARNGVLLARWHAGRGSALAAAVRWLASGFRSAHARSRTERARGRARIRGAVSALAGPGTPAPPRLDDFEARAASSPSLELSGR